ncbi:MAG: exodeoxyribonuclease VII large subunit [Alphaproteobacteria bacterium]|nr:exodeoxyribonuclease VII large subunit [Alphaproteobacteria bacterium]
MNNNIINSLPLFDYKNKNYPEYTVSEVSNIIKKSIEDNFEFVRIRGEISGLKIAPSGHVYFSLKDQSAVLSAVCWKGIASTLKHKPEEGLEVVCSGSITTYQGQSKYQMMVKSLAPAGVGALMALLEKRKEEFSKEGLFDSKHKLKIPFMPKTIAVVTSPTGAVIRDIIHRIEDRYPCRIIVWPVLVQGDAAAQQITKAIYGLNNLRDDDLKPDVMIVARGGGSLEDLWPFNEEIVVRAVFNSKIPIISAVGHETDTTLIDYVSDMRAPTPTAAAEFAVPVRKEIILNLSELQTRQNNAIKNYQTNALQLVKSLSHRLPNLDYLVNNYTQKLDDLNLRLIESLPKYAEILNNKLGRLIDKLKIPDYHFELCTKNLNISLTNLQNITRNLFKEKIYQLRLASRDLKIDITAREKEFLHTIKLLDSYHYKNTLKRGFAIVRGKDNKMIKSIHEIKGDHINIEVVDGKKDIKIDSV